MKGEVCVCVCACKDTNIYLCLCVCMCTSVYVCVCGNKKRAVMGRVQSRVSLRSSSRQTALLVINGKTRAIEQLSAFSIVSRLRNNLTITSAWEKRHTVNIQGEPCEGQFSERRHLYVSVCLCVCVCVCVCSLSQCFFGQYWQQSIVYPSLINSFQSH